MEYKEISFKEFFDLKYKNSGSIYDHNSKIITYYRVGNVKDERELTSCLHKIGLKELKHDNFSVATFSSQT